MLKTGYATSVQKTISVAFSFLAIVLFCTALIFAAPLPFSNEKLSEPNDLDAVRQTQEQGLRIWDRRCEPFVRFFQTRDDILVVRSGEYVAGNFATINAQENSLEILSESMTGPHGSLPLRTRVFYKLRQNRLSICYQFEAAETVELSNGLDVTMASSNWKVVKCRNQFSTLKTILFKNRDQNYHQALQQVYEFCDKNDRLVMLFPNPFHSMVTIEERAPRLLFYWHVLPGGPLIKSYKPAGPPLASVLEKGSRIQRELELVILDKYERIPSIPLAYFSPFPKAFDQIITIGLDDIPFQRWKFPLSGSDVQAPVQRDLIHLLEKHPQMKMSWVVVPDAITHKEELANPDYPVGQWWRAHGQHRIAAAGPYDYQQWLRDIDQHKVVLGYEDRVALGSHGLHHTPEQEYGLNWEFQYYDPIFCDSTMHAILQEYDLLGLSAASRRWIRFPGFVFTRSAIDALIKYKFLLFDYGPAAIALPWTTYKSPYGQIWGMQAQWEGDTPQPFSVMDEILAQGMVCHCAGHPWVWFKNGDSTAFNKLDEIFSMAEKKYPHLGYLWPDEMGQFAQETADLHYLSTSLSKQEFLFSFTGKTSEQSVYIEWPSYLPAPQRMLVDNIEQSSWQFRSGRLICTLPELPDGVHTIRLPVQTADADLENEIISVHNTELKLGNAFPNPFHHSTTIRIEAPQSAENQMAVTIFNGIGKRVRRLFHGSIITGVYDVQWDGLDDRGQRLAAGVYFCRVDGFGSSKTLKLLFLP